MQVPAYPQNVLDLIGPHLCGDGLAVVDSGGRMSYRDLDAFSGGLAQELLRNGVTQGDPVIVHARLGRYAIAAMLGVLRAGARYIAIDAMFPLERQRAIAIESGAQHALVEPGLDVKLEPAPQWTFDMDGVTRGRVMMRGSLAYTCYTSGSTGRPKGITVSSNGLAYSTQARLAYYPTRVRGFLLCSSISFDSSVAGIYWTLASGGTLVIPSDRPSDLVAMGRFARKHRPSHMLMVPSLYAVALRGGLGEEFDSLDTVIVAGESCPPSLVRQHYSMLPGAALYNEYGPTEYTVWASVHRCTADDAERRSVPIGRPIPGTRAFIRNGELHLDGPGLAVNVPRPYPTGDLVTVQDGLLVYQGRRDSQLKLGGVRVERAEIENAIATFPGVTTAAVAVADGVLTGHIVSGQQTLDLHRLRGHLLHRLPAAAVPKRIKLVQRLPLLPNGKVNYAELDQSGTVQRTDSN